VALPVGSALKDDGKVGEYVIIDSSVRWIAAAVMTKHHLLAMTLAERDSAYHKERAAMTLADKKRGSRKTAPILFRLTGLEVVFSF
jgi:hypothetical protein